MRRIVMLLAATLIVTVPPAATAGASQPHASRAPAFVAMPCPGFFPAGRDVDCGYVRVPEDRTKAHSPMITVAAAVVRATSEHPAADPIVFVDGGPSFGAISPFALGGYFATWPFARDRDLILVDTRGTGLSEPRLGCPELDAANVEAFYSKPLINADAPQIFRRALTACWDRLVADGVDPRAYTSAESAADLEALRRALGINRWNLLAISADGVVGSTYVRLFPDHVRAVVYDSTMSPQAEWGPDFDRGFDQSLEKVFQGCQANAACRAKYPHIRRRFYRQIHRLHANPVSIRMPGFKPEPVTVEIDGVGFYTDAVFSMYAGDVQTPSHLFDPLDYIWRVSHGQIRDQYREWFGNGPVTNGHDNDFVAEGKTMSYACHDLLNFLDAKDLRRAARDIAPLAPRYLGQHYDLGLGFTNAVSPEGCKSWPVGRAPRSQHRAPTGNTPTLVLGGEYDMGMPPYVVRHMDDELTNAHYYEFPASDHLQLASFTNGHVCAREIAAAFLTDPAATLDASCIEELPQADFTPTGAGRQLPGRWHLRSRR